MELGKMILQAIVARSHHQAADVTIGGQMGVVHLCKLSGFTSGGDPANNGKQSHHILDTEL